MRWTATMWGRPPSINATYRPIVEKSVRTGGHNLAIAKSDIAHRWQADMTITLRAARPSRWKPEGYVVVWYWLFLGKDMDADNPVKGMLDAIQEATGVDDKHFLPRCVWKTLGTPANMERVELVIEEVDAPEPWWPM